MDPTKTPRRLRGHTSTATCCIASSDRPAVIATSGEDGCVCLFDLRCKDVQRVMKVHDDAISSLCFKRGNENLIYTSSGSQVKCFDIQMPTFETPMESYAYNKEEVNQISCNLKSSFLAAADDSGDVKIIDIQQRRPFKTLRAGHESICSSVQFLPWKPWEVVTGGLDCKMIMWDFSKGRAFLVVDFGNMEDKRAPGQYYNPAFIHAIAVPEMEMVNKLGKSCAVARGDGVVSLINLASELDAVKSKTAAKTRKSSESKLKNNPSASEQDSWKRLHLDYAEGGHTAAASCVAFSAFGEKGKFVVSGGNDKAVKLWDWSRSVQKKETSEGTTTDDDDVVFSIDVKKKVNWLCTTAADAENLVVCDTSKVVKVYTVS